MSRTISFKGKLADGEQEKIFLSTIDGKMGYKIKKFSTIDETPGTANVELLTKIYKTLQSTVDGNVDFSDNRLLGMAYFGFESSGSTAQTIIFDNEIFNQDIYITHTDNTGNNKPVNYYIELEQVKLDIGENTVATLKDIRNSNIDLVI